MRATTLAVATVVIAATSCEALGACIVSDPTGTPTNVRGGPRGDIINTLGNGDEVRILEVRNDVRGKSWARVSGAAEGWVFRDYLDCAEGKIQTAGSASLWIRKVSAKNKLGRTLDQLVHSYEYQGTCTARTNTDQMPILHHDFESVRLGDSVGFRHYFTVYGPGNNKSIVHSDTIFNPAQIYHIRDVDWDRNEEVGLRLSCDGDERCILQDGKRTSEAYIAFCDPKARREVHSIIKSSW